MISARMPSHDGLKLLRLAGLGVVAAAAGVLLWNLRAGGPHDAGVSQAAWVALAIGWVILIVAILMRSRYLRHQRSGE